MKQNTATFKKIKKASGAGRDTKIQLKEKKSTKELTITAKAGADSEVILIKDYLCVVVLCFPKYCAP